MIQILALDKRFVDPRRTLNPSQAEKEEGIIPLTDSLPIIPQVHSISCLVSAPCPSFFPHCIKSYAPLSCFTVVHHTLPQSRRSKRHSNSSSQARVNNTRLCLWSGSLLHKACSFKDLRLPDRRFQLRTSFDHDCGSRCSHLHHLGPVGEEGTK